MHRLLWLSSLVTVGLACTAGLVDPDDAAPPAEEPTDGGVLLVDFPDEFESQEERAGEEPVEDYPPAEEVDGGSPCDRSTPPSNKPFVLFYGMFQSNGLPDQTLNQRLIDPALDVIFDVRHPTVLYSGSRHTCSPHSAEFQKWKSLGARLARRVPSTELGPMLDDGTALPTLIGYLEDGWDYVSIDELSLAKWADSTAWGTQLRTLLTALTAAGHGGKAIVYFSPGTTAIARPPGTSNDPLASFKQLFKVCKQHCRRLVPEAYSNPTIPVTAQMLTSNVIDPGIKAAQWLEWLATRMDDIEPNTTLVTSTILGIANVAPSTRYLNVPQCDLAPFRGDCKVNGVTTFGSLRQQLAQLHSGAHAKKQCGVAFYTPSRVAADPQNTVWTADDLSTYLKTLTSWWANPNNPRCPGQVVGP